MKARSASHSRAADAVNVSRTVCKSKVERLMTLSTSAVAVSRSNDSSQFAREPCDLCFLAGTGRTATADGFWPIAAL